VRRKLGVRFSYARFPRNGWGEKSRSDVFGKPAVSQPVDAGRAWPSPDVTAVCQ